MVIMSDLEWPNAFISYDLLWKVQKRHVVNIEESFNMNKSYLLGVSDNFLLDNNSDIDAWYY